MTERTLRDALRELGDVPLPAGDLAGAALGRARRQRRRGATLAIAAALAVTAATAAPVLAVREGRPATRALPVGSAGHVVEAYAAVGADRWLPGATSLLLDRDTGRYVPLPVDFLAVSPDGRHVAVWDDADAGRVTAGPVPELPRRTVGPQRAGVADRAALLREGLAAARWLPLGHPYRPTWSAGGELLVSARLARGSVTRVVRVDPATGRFTADVTVPTAVADPEVAEASWAPDGRGFTLTDRGRVLFLDWTARPVGAWSLPTGLLSGPAARSPSGALLVLGGVSVSRGERAAGVQLVVDSRTGREVARFGGSAPVVGWSDDAHVLRLRGAGPVLDVVDLQGRVVAEVPVEPHRSIRAGWLQVAPAGSLPPAAAPLEF